MKIRKLAAAVAVMATLGASAQSPKYIFYYIGDGMGMGPVVAAETYNRVILNSDKPLNMMQMPVVGWCMTYSASSTITDSAAAGTALSAGTKTKNGMLGMNPDTADVVSVAKKLQAMGYGIGVTTSGPPTTQPRVHSMPTCRTAACSTKSAPRWPVQTMSLSPAPDCADS